MIDRIFYFIAPSVRPISFQPAQMAIAIGTVLLLGLWIGPLARAQAELSMADGEEDMLRNLHLVDETGPQVLDLLEQLTGKRVLVQQNLPQVKINFNSRGPISRESAIVALESLLSLNGIAVTAMGDEFVKAVPIAGVARQAPQMLGGDILQLPPSQRVYARIYPLSYLNVSRAVSLLQPVVSQPDLLAPIEGANAVLITDSLANLQRAERILQRFDQMAQFPDEVTFVALQHSTAGEVQERIARLRDSALSGRLRENTVIEADERSNQLIVIGHPAEMPLLVSLIEQLDVAVDPRTSSEVYYIKHGEALGVVNVLTTLIDGQAAAMNAVNARSASTRAGVTASRTAAAVPAAETAGEPASSPTTAVIADAIGTVLTDTGAVSNLQFSPYVTLVADERSNAIVAYGTPSDLRQLGALIEKIDVLLAQVRIEVVIAEVTLQDNEVSGLNSFGIDWNMPGSTPDGDLSFRTGTPALNAGGEPALGISGAVFPFRLETVFRVAREKTNVRILSAPTVVTTHNQQAEINVSESRPIITGSISDTTNPNASRSTIQYRDIGIQLRVKPLIGANGVIQMEIEQTVENVVSTQTIDGNEQPIIGKRQATSFISLADQEVIVLGGLQSVQSSDTDGRVFILGDLPLIGNLFRPRTVRESVNELIIFIKPYIVSSAQESDFLAQQDLRNSLVGDQVVEFFETGRMAAPRVFPAEEEEVEAVDSNRPPVKRFHK